MNECVIIIYCHIVRSKMCQVPLFFMLSHVQFEVAELKTCKLSSICIEGEVLKYLSN